MISLTSARVFKCNLKRFNILGRPSGYKDSIVAFLAQAQRPQDIEKIRVAAGIGNWNTALKHCLELQIEGKLQGQKSSKSWTFWVEKKSRRNGTEAT